MNATADDPGRPTRVRYQVLAVGCVLALLTYIFRLGFSSAVPEIKRDLGFDDEQMGYLASAFLVAYAVFQVPAGILGDRFGGRKVLTFLVLAWSALTAAVAFTVFLPAEAMWQLSFLLVVRFLFGMFQAGGFPVWARVVADWMPLTERGFAQGTVWTFSRLGGALSPFIFLWLLRLFGTWTTPFWMLACVGGLWSLAFWVWFRDRPENMQQVNEAERTLIVAGRETASNQAGPVPWSKLLRSKSVWGLCLMYGFGGFAGNFITSLLPLYLSDHRHLDPSVSTRIFGQVLACGMFSCVAGGFLSDLIIRSTGNRKWGRRVNGALGLAFAGLTCFTVPFTNSVELVGLLFSVWFFCNDMIMGPAWAACADIAEGHAGTVSGAMNMTGSLFGAASMSLAGYLLQTGQAKFMFLLFGCSYAVATACWLLVDVTKPLVEKQ